MMTIITADNNLAILAVLLSVVSFGLWIETRPRIGQFGVIGIVLLCVLLNAFSILPNRADIYSLISQFLVPLAIPLLLFNADVRQIWRQSGRMLLAFGLAVAATLIGAMLALSLTEMHSNESTWAAIVTAGFIGSAANTAAVAAALGKTVDPFMGLLFASVYVVTVPFVILMLALPGIPRLWRWFSTIDESTVIRPASTEVAPEVDSSLAQTFALEARTETGVTARSLSLALALSAVIVWFSQYLAGLTGFPPLQYLMISAISIVIATLLPHRVVHLAGHQSLGHYFLYLFFAVIGTQVDFTQALSKGGEIMQFAAILLTSHLLLLALFGRFLKLSGAQLIVASNACILGPPMAAAAATARGWHHLVTPGILCGVLGYIIANFIGIAFAQWL